MLFTIGAGPQVVAVSSYDEDPPQVKSLPRVGALLDPDVERILSLKPDLVITYGSQVDLQSQLHPRRHPDVRLPARRPRRHRRDDARAGRPDRSRARGRGGRP